MAKKIRFPLEMDDDVEVRTMEELKEKFSLEKVLFYLSNGKLGTWLRDRYLDDIADAISELNQEDSEFNRKICGIFEVKYDEKSDADIEKAAERNRKTALLKEFTSEKSFFDVADLVAFDQDDLYNLLDEDETTVYLCGDRFSIPISKENMKYIGINNPVVVIGANEIVVFESKGIVFEGVSFDEKYQKILDNSRNVKVEKIENSCINSCAEYGNYLPSSYMNFLLSVADKASAKGCYEKVCGILENLQYDINTDIENIRSELVGSELAGMGDKYLMNL